MLQRFVIATLAVLVSGPAFAQDLGRVVKECDQAGGVKWDKGGGSGQQTGHLAGKAAASPCAAAAKAAPNPAAGGDQPRTTRSSANAKATYQPGGSSGTRSAGAQATGVMDGSASADQITGDRRAGAGKKSKAQ